ncbi:MAG: ammonium transporter [Planctomycetaceae bacterium]
MLRLKVLATTSLAALLLVAIFQPIAARADEKTPETTATKSADTKPAEKKTEEKPTLEEKVAATEKTSSSNAGNLDALWTLLAAFLVFFMQAGFALVETGFTRAKNACNIIMKNLMDFSLGSLLFWLVGFGLMFGASEATGGWLGTNNFLFDAASEDATATGNSESYAWAFLIFQTVFCATAATIVSGAMAERTKFTSYLLYSIGITAIVYPVFGSWAWGNLWAGGDAWLAKKGFADFAGSTVVHSIGGWCALAGAIVIGPRLGKYKNGKTVPIPGHNIPLAALGVFILWLGWFGFNPGSTTAIRADHVAAEGATFAYIAVTTNLAAAAGAVAAMLVAWIKFKKPDPSFALNGALAGLVAITAGCNVMTPFLSVLTGAVGGVLVVFSVLFLDKLKIDDPVGAVSVHGVCGAWGTLAIGLFPLLGFKLAFGAEASLMTQAIGVFAAFAWAFPVSFAIFYTIKMTVGLRVSEQEEIEGLDMHEHGMLAYPAGFVSDIPTGSAGAGMPAAYSSTPSPVASSKPVTE